MPVRRRQVIDVIHPPGEEVVDLVGHAQQRQHIDGNNGYRCAVLVLRMSRSVVNNGSQHSNRHRESGKAGIEDESRGMEIVVEDQSQHTQSHRGDSKEAQQIAISPFPDPHQHR